MIDSRASLTVQHDANSVFTDYSNVAADYIRDNFNVTVASATDYIYLGFHKPFGATYVELPTPNTNSASLSAEVYDGTAWVAVDLDDETQGLTRSGFIFWERSGMNSVDVNSIEKYYIRFRPSVGTSAVDVRAINLVFSDDTMMKAEFFDIDNSNLLPPGETSHISAHVASRNQIVQHFRNLGVIKYNSTTGYEDITQWDLLDIFEIRQGATFLALSKIFFNLSDSPEDDWWIKYMDYKARFERSMKIAFSSFDSDDDGAADVAEEKANRPVQRWNR